MADRETEIKKEMDGKMNNLSKVYVHPTNKPMANTNQTTVA